MNLFRFAIAAPIAGAGLGGYCVEPTTKLPTRNRTHVGRQPFVRRLQTRTARSYFLSTGFLKNGKVGAGFLPFSRVVTTAKAAGSYCSDLKKIKRPAFRSSASATTRCGG